jgi:predicted ATPase
MIVEDAHWIDPTSLEVFGRTVDRIKTLPVLLIVTFRPEFNAPWAGRSHVTSLSLNRLGEREATAIIVRLVGNKELPADVMAEIVERTDGIPLFVEEMTKAVLKAGGAGEARHIAAAVPSAALAVPASLHASLMARLDRLGSAKDVAQIGAAIGREFSHPLLAAVMAEPEAKLQSALDRLVTAGLLFRQGAPPHTTYLFKHALVQDAAYGTLLREPRRALHARIAEIIESQFAEIAESQPELLAHHFTQAGLTEPAVEWWGKAGQRSLERSALLEATAQFTRALDHIAALPGTPALRREELKLQVALITPLIHIKGYAAPETRAAIERARLLIDQAQERGERPEDPLILCSALYGFLMMNIAAFNGDVLPQHATEFLALAEKEGTKALLMTAHRVFGMYSFYSGDIIKSCAHFDCTIELYDPVEHRPLTTRFGTDALAHALCYRSWANWLLGYPERARADAHRALQGAREMGQAGTLMAILTLTTHTHIFCGDCTAAATQLDELSGFAEEKGALYWKAQGAWLQGWLLALAGKTAEAVYQLTSGITAWRSTGATLFAPTQLSVLAAAYARLGKFDEVQRSIGEAMTGMEKSKEIWFETEVNRIAGEIALISPDTDAAKTEAYFERALAVARQQQAKSWELRAAMSMARLWRSQGRVQQARELLAPVYGWFTEGFDTRDLKEAKALLDQLI